MPSGHGKKETRPFVFLLVEFRREIGTAFLGWLSLKGNPYPNQKVDKMAPLGNWDLCPPSEPIEESSMFRGRRMWVLFKGPSPKIGGSFCSLFRYQPRKPGSKAILLRSFFGGDSLPHGQRAIRLFITPSWSPGRGTTRVTIKTRYSNG